MDEFKKALLPLAERTIEAKTLEVKHRLKEIKQVLQYPNGETPIAESIEKIINNIPPEMRMPKRLPKGKKALSKFIEPADMVDEKEKAVKILEQVEMVMRVKRLHSDQERLVLAGAKRLKNKKDL